MLHTKKTPPSSKNDYDTDGIAKWKSKRIELLRSHLCCRCGIMNNMVIVPSVNAVLTIAASYFWQAVGSLILSNFHFTLVRHYIKNCSPVPYEPIMRTLKDYGCCIYIRHAVSYIEIYCTIKWISPSIKRVVRFLYKH